jgi:hypothetical protein
MYLEHKRNYITLHIEDYNKLCLQYTITVGVNFCSFGLRLRPGIEYNYPCR